MLHINPSVWQLAAVVNGERCMKNILGMVLITAFLTACAERPENIAAAEIGSGVYRGQSCAQLAERSLHYTQQLEALSADQNRAATGDAWGVFLLGLPMSSMTGNDRETDIAVTRGHLNEISSARQQRNCT
jgi:hypothetical protein